MPLTSHYRAVAGGGLLIALTVNIAGYVWDLYERFSWFDEVIHTYTAFAITLPLALLLYGVVLSGAETRPILFVLTAASLGLAIGTLWEIVEWGYDQVVPGNVILGKTDTMIDLILDFIGALAAGIVSSRMVQDRSDK